MSFDSSCCAAETTMAREELVDDGGWYYAIPASGKSARELEMRPSKSGGGEQES
jgi:hypothetical protein